MFGMDLTKSYFFSFPHPNRQREKDHTSSHQESSVIRVGPESAITSGNKTIVSLFQLSQGINILKEQQYCSDNMSNENHVPRVPRITPTYTTLSYADILKKALSANHNPEMTTENDEPQSQPGQTTTMPTENGNPPAISYTAAAKTGLPSSNTSNQNRRPRSPGDSSTTSPTNETDTTLATLGSHPSPSQPTVEANGGNSTDSSDQPLAASRRRRRSRRNSSTQTREPLPENPDTQAKPSKSAQASQAGQSSSQAPRPTPKPTFNGLFLRSVVASCGCLYMAECKSENWRPSRHSLRRAGFPLKGRCSRCHVLVTEIRFNEKNAEAEVTEIVLPAGKGEEEEEQQAGQQHVGREDVAEIYIDDDVEDVDEDQNEDGYESDYGESSEASQLQDGSGVKTLQADVDGAKDAPVDGVLDDESMMSVD
ncbi:hypothetical protein QBC45DRAFT_453032 [Copromyces sp. CBS 386.78]|nr:hypothetical protein QBC45DRAFT_453032 [Copromyces sp. CBS 386.78]